MEFLMMELDHQLHHEPSFEDDLYYAELERQILLLTADDDDVTDNGSVFGAKTPLPLVSPTKHASSSADMAAAVVGTDFLTWQHSYSNHRGSGGATPWQKSNGTGVFIPQTIVKSQTSSRSYSTARTTNYGRRMKRQTEYNDIFGSHKMYRGIKNGE